MHLFGFPNFHIYLLMDNRKRDLQDKVSYLLFSNDKKLNDSQSSAY